MTSTDEARTLRALGLCAKARKLIYGTPMICEALHAKKRVYLVLISDDNAPNTDKRLFDRCTFYGVPTVRLASTGEELAAALGKESRLAAVAVSDENMYRLVMGTLETEK